MQVWDGNARKREQPDAVWVTHMDTREGRQAAAVQVMCVYAQVSLIHRFHFKRPWSWLCCILAHNYCRNRWFGQFLRPTVNSTRTRWGQLRENRRRPCSSEGGKVRNRVSELYQDACGSGGRERVVRFEIFKKGGLGASGRHTGSRNTPQISKRFPKWGSKRTCDRGNSSPAVYFSVSDSCSWLILTRPLAQTHTAMCTRVHTLSEYQRASALLTNSKGEQTVKVNSGDMNLPAVIVLKHGSVTPQERNKKTEQNRKCNWHRTVLCVDDWQLKDIHQQKVLSDALLTQWSHTWLGTAPRD